MLAIAENAAAGIKACTTCADHDQGAQHQKIVSHCNPFRPIGNFSQQRLIESPYVVVETVFSTRIAEDGKKMFAVDLAVCSAVELLLLTPFSAQLVCDIRRILVLHSLFRD